MKTSSEPLWFRNGPETLIHELAGTTVIFDPLSGESHFLTELPALLLACIDEQPVTSSELIRRVAGAIDLTPEYESKIKSALHLLVDAELVESSALDS